MRKTRRREVKVHFGSTMNELHCVCVCVCLLQYGGSVCLAIPDRCRHHGSGGSRNKREGGKRRSVKILEMCRWRKATAATRINKLRNLWTTRTPIYTTLTLSLHTFSLQHCCSTHIFDAETNAIIVEQKIFKGNRWSHLEGQTYGIAWFLKITENLTPKICKYDILYVPFGMLIVFPLTVNCSCRHTVPASEIATPVRDWNHMISRVQTQGGI